MSRLIRPLGASSLVCLMLGSAPAIAADMMFQLINDTERPLSLKLYSRAESHQEWPSKTKFYTIRPDAAVQQLKLKCEEGEQICWGAWMKVEDISGDVDNSGKRNIRTTKITYGAGDRGMDTCTECCHVCKDGSLTPAFKMKDAEQSLR